MPQRLLRPGLRQSERFNRLDFFCQSFYLRLLTLVDDYGRYEAHPTLLASEAFPYGDPEGKTVLPQHITDCLKKLRGAEMLWLYEVDGKQLLQLARWKEKPRSESKYPSMQEDNRTVPASPEHLLERPEHLFGPKPQMITSPPSPSPSPSPKPSPVASNCLEESDSKNRSLHQMLNFAFKRDLKAAWSYEEDCLALDVIRRPEAIQEAKEILQWRPLAGKYFPSSIRRLLEDWTHVLDRARNHVTEPAKLSLEEKNLQAARRLAENL